MNLLSTAYNSFTSSDLGAAKNYFANGTTNGTTTAVAPTGFTLPTFNGLPNATNNVYDTAYGVKNTDPGQNIFGSSRPMQVRPPDGSAPSINAFDPTAISGFTTNPSFPSGHTTYAYTELDPARNDDARTLSELAIARRRIRQQPYRPWRALSARHHREPVAGELRPLASVHQPGLHHNATTTGTAINLPSSFTSAAPELNSFLSAGCGGTVASCAANLVNPYAPSAANAGTYANNLTYGLPTLTLKQRRKRPRPPADLMRPSCSPRSTAAAAPAAKALAQCRQRRHGRFGPCSAT